MQSTRVGNNLHAKGLSEGNHPGRHEAKPIMNSRITDSSELIDRKTSRSICDAVGERLQQSLRPLPSDLSPRLQHLMDQLRKRDGQDHFGAR
jgi:hypothetical protein